MKKKDLITIFAGLAVVIVLAVVFMRGDQLQHLIKAIETGSPMLLFIALACQAMKYVTQGLSFTWCFRAADARMPIGINILLVFQTFFIDTVIPSFNISGTSTVIEVATKRGVEAGRATGAALLRQVSITAAFVIIMIIGFAILFAMGKLKTGWIILGVGSVLTVGGLVLAMFLSAARPQLVLRIAAPFERVIDKVLARLKKRSIDASLKGLVDTYASSAKDMAHNPACIFLELLFAVVANVFEIGCFYFVGLAFGLNNLEAIICVYVVVSLAAVASPVPQGIGVAEGVALVAFTLFGVEQATAMAIIMVYRVAALWIPFIMGAILMRGVDVDVDKLHKISAKRRASATVASKGESNGNSE